MGYALAEEFLNKGSEMILVSGPVDIRLTHPKLIIINVNSAPEMDLACCNYFEEIDIAIFAAAVADYRPEFVSKEKIKKDDASFSLKMIKNVDIAYEFGKVKTSRQLSIGFALETNDELKHATCKLLKKNFDMVVLNSVRDSNATFGYDTNKITIIKNDFTQQEFSVKSKNDVAKDILGVVNDLCLKRKVKAVTANLT